MGKRLISSILGIPIVLLQAIFLFVLVNVSYDLFVGDVNGIRIALLIASIVGLIMLLGLSLLKKRTVVNLLRDGMGA